MREEVESVHLCGVIVGMGERCRDVLVGWTRWLVMIAGS